MIVAGGGTGGHLFPGLAVAEAAADGGDAVLFVGSAFGIEARVIPQTRFEFEPISIRGLRGRGLRGMAQLAVQLPTALARAWRIVGRFGAQLVLGGMVVVVNAVVYSYVFRRRHHGEETP